MQYFNRTFFKFAFGFIGIIAISMIIIIAAGAAGNKHDGKKICIFDCSTVEAEK